MYRANLIGLLYKRFFCEGTAADYMNSNDSVYSQIASWTKKCSRKMRSIPRGNVVPGNRLFTGACKEVEDENDDEDEDDWGSGGRELRPTIAAIVCIKAIDQSGQRCYNRPEHFLKTVCKRRIFTGWLSCLLPPLSQSFSSSSSFSSSAFGKRSCDRKSRNR